jgi:hypothetical protein
MLCSKNGAVKIKAFLDFAPVTKAAECPQGYRIRRWATELDERSDIVFLLVTCEAVHRGRPAIAMSSYFTK